MVKVRPTSDAEVARSAVTRGNAGVYMSVANGGTALCNANVMISNMVTVGAPAAGRACTPAENETDESSRPVIAHRQAPPSSYDDRGRTVSTRAMWSRNSDMKSRRKTAVASLVTSPSSVKTSGE